MDRFTPAAVSLSRIACRKAAFSSRLARILSTVTILVTLTLVTSWRAEGQPIAAACQAPPTGYHYAATGSSGYGSNKGTGAWQDTWSSWSLNGHSDGFSNEAVWVRDYNDQSNGLEVGFSVGSSTIGYKNYMHPYWTYSIGESYTPKDYSTVLPTNTAIWDSATSNGTDSWAYVNNTYLYEIQHGVATPRWDYEQTEVNYHDIWMGGGSGSGMTLSYQDSSNNWHNWGFISGVTYYFVPGHTGYSPAGYGYYIDTAQPATATQGGYGSCS